MRYASVFSGPWILICAGSPVLAKCFFKYKVMQFEQFEQRQAPGSCVSVSAKRPLAPFTTRLGAHLVAFAVFFYISLVFLGVLNNHPPRGFHTVMQDVSFKMNQGD